MDIGLYRRFLEEYIQEAYDSSDGTPAGITEYLRSIKPPGRFTRNREERKSALRGGDQSLRRAPPLAAGDHLFPLRGRN